jgi:hypothetical protein
MGAQQGVCTHNSIPVVSVRAIVAHAQDAAVLQSLCLRAGNRSDLAAQLVGLEVVLVGVA